MSLPIKHKVSGLGAWESLKLPDINCRLSDSGLFVWHGCELMIVSLSSFEVARCVTTSGFLIDFFEVFSDHCYIVSHDNSDSLIYSFNLNSSGMTKFRLPRRRIISIEHIDAFTFFAGTDNAWLIKVSQGVVTSSIRVLELESPEIICLKSYTVGNEVTVACGMSNGSVMLVDAYGKIDSVPRQIENCGRVAGIEMISYKEQDYFVIFREKPASFSVVKLSDEEMDYHEEWFERLDENIGLIQISCFNSCGVFVLALNENKLKLYFYSLLVSSQELKELYSDELNMNDMKSVITFSVPESSMFFNSKEFGCDLCMVTTGGSAIQVISLTSSVTESLVQLIVDNTQKHSIWQKPELQTHVLREYTQISSLEGEYPEEDLKIIDLLESCRKASIISDFLLRSAGDRLVLPDECEAIVKNWLQMKFDIREQYMMKELLTELIHGNDNEELRKEMYKVLESLFELHKIALALELRSVRNNALGKCKVTAKRVESFIFVVRVCIWINEHDLVNSFTGKNFDNQRERMRNLRQITGNTYASLEFAELLLDSWTKLLSVELSNTFNDPLTKESVFELLIYCDQNIFIRFFIYLLLDIEQECLEHKNIHMSFINDFFISESKVEYIRGCFCLDMLTHPRTIPIDGNKESTIQFASDALFELVKITENLTNDEKIQILQCFYVNQCEEQAVHWVLVCEFDWRLPLTIINVMGVFFGSDQHWLDEKYNWVRAYALINVLDLDHSNIPELMKAFTDLMIATKRMSVIPTISFNTHLKIPYINAVPPHPIASFFTLFYNNLKKTAFNEFSMDIDSPELREEFNYIYQHLKKFTQHLYDAPIHTFRIDAKRSQLFSQKKQQKSLNSQNLELLQQSNESLKPKALFSTPLSNNSNRS